MRIQLYTIGGFIGFSQPFNLGGLLPFHVLIVHFDEIFTSNTIKNIFNYRRFSTNIWLQAREMGAGPAADDGLAAAHIFSPKTEVADGSENPVVNQLS